MYVTVVGLVLMAFEAFGDDPAEVHAVTILFAAAAATLFALGTYLVLQRKLSRIIIGLGLLTHGANILLITVGPTRRPTDHRRGRSRRTSATRCRRRSRSPPSSSPSA